MTKVEITIDGSFTVDECRKMAQSIGATLHSTPGGRLFITKQKAFGLPGIDVVPIRTRFPSNVLPLRGDR